MDIISFVILIIIVGILVGIIIIPTIFVENLKKNENTKKILKKNFLWADVQTFLWFALLLLLMMVVIFLFTGLGNLLF